MNNTDHHNQLVTTARYTGIWYLLMAISGILGFMVFHPQLFISGEAEKTLENLTNFESLARIRLFMEFVIIVSQALAAVWFYKLFKGINEWAAWTLGLWGMVNAIVIMISAIAMSSAIDLAAASTPSVEEKIALMQLLTIVITNAWGVGSLFFGLWLIPMGYIVVSSKRMPVWLGRVLIIGGIGYLIGTFLKYFGIDGTWTEFLVVPATIGEFWMIGYLLVFGVRGLIEE